MRSGVDDRDKILPVPCRIAGPGKEIVSCCLRAGRACREQESGQRRSRQMLLHGKPPDLKFRPPIQRLSPALLNAVSDYWARENRYACSLYREQSQCPVSRYAMTASEQPDGQVGVGSRP